MIYIIRHGQTEKNKANLLQGRSEHPLNETGIRQFQKILTYVSRYTIPVRHICGIHRPSRVSTAHQKASAAHKNLP